MIVALSTWKFDVDVTQTMAYSAGEAAGHCTCGYCRNFYAAVDQIYPDLRPFLAEFGIDVEAPDELMPYDVGERMWFDCTYAVCGRILRMGQSEVSINGVSLRFSAENTYSINHSCPEPNFYITVSDAELPWVLNESAEEILSPSNEEGFFLRMVDKLADKTKEKFIT